MKCAVPKLLVVPLTLLGHASAGVALFSTGIILAGSRVVVSGRVLLIVMIKNILQPALVFYVLVWLDYTNPILEEAVLTSALPTLVLVVMLSIEYKLAVLEAASSVLISTAASLITIGAFISFLAKYE
jgi:predicted permease